MNEFFPSNPRKVEPLTDTEGGARMAEASHLQETVKDSEPVQDATGRANEDAVSPHSLSPLAGDATYYRSFRALSMAIIIGNALTALSVIGLALIFTVSQQRQLSMSQEQMRVVFDKVMATNEILMTRLGEAHTIIGESASMLGKSGAEIAVLRQDITNVKATTEDRLREMKEKFVKQRLAPLPVNMTAREINTVGRQLTSISAKTENKHDKRAIEALKQKSYHTDRASYYKEYARVLSTLDERVRAEMEDKVGKVILGD